MAQTILIVDDEPSQLQLTRHAVEQKLHFSVATAESGADAVEYVRGRQTPEPDLMLLDLSMPGMGGLEVIQAVRPVAPRLPIIVLTMYGDLEKAVAAVRAGANDFLAKPVTLERLHISITNLLRMHALEEALKRSEQMRLKTDETPPAWNGHAMPANAHALEVANAQGGLRTLAEIERGMIELTLAHHRGCMAKAARALGIGRSTLYRKIQELGLERPGMDNAEPPQKTATTPETRAQAG